MIELTDEMVRAFNDARAALNQEQMHGRPPKSEEVKRRAGLTAVLAIVERDRQAAAQQEWDALQPCPSPDPSGVWFCERVLGHAGKHTALRWHEVWS